MTTVFNEKRAYPRVPLNSQFILHLQGEKYSGSVANISLVGLKLTNIKPEIAQSNIGQSVELFFDESDAATSVKCRFSYIDSNNAGVSFCSEIEKT